jgi:hypothetical protein
MLLLAAIAAASPPTVQATATVRIERPARASREAWERLPAQSKREVVVRDDEDRPIRLRLVENQ